VNYKLKEAVPVGFGAISRIAETAGLPELSQKK
jgi:hypothetical protein